MKNSYGTLMSLLNRDIINKKTILLGNLIILPFVFLFGYYVFSCEIDHWIHLFLGLIILSMFIQFISLNLVSFKDSILSQIMLFCSYLFHLSFILLIALNYDFGKTASNLPFIRYDVESARSAFQISWLFIYGFYGGILGSLMVQKKDRKKIPNISSLGSIKNKDIKKMGILLVMIACPFFLHRTLTFISDTFRNGYGYAANKEYNTYFQLIMKLMLPGLILWMCSYKDSKKKSLYVFVLGLFLYSLAMLTGQRSFNFMYLLVLLLFYLGYVMKIKLNFKHILLIIPFIVFASFILTFIREARVNGLNLNINEVLSNANNPLLSMLNEFGITSNIVTYTYIKSESPLYGLQIFTSLFILVPGVSHLFPFINFSKLNNIDALNAWNLGGSFIADFYFDFHYMGFAACFVFGFIIQKLFCFYTNQLREKKIVAAAYLCPILCDVIFCVRSTTYKIPRLTVYYSFFFLIACFTLDFLEKKGKDEMFVNKIKNNDLLYYVYYAFRVLIPRFISFHTGRMLNMNEAKYNFSKIKKYKNVYKNKRCFIVATAPSLDIKDLNLIKNELSFGVNSIVLSFASTGWRPTFYGLQDNNAYTKLEKDILKYRNEVKDMFCGISSKTLSPEPKCDCTYYRLNLLDHDKRGTNHKNKCWSDVDKFVYDGHSITYSMIEIAMYMGFNEICLLGVDCDYSSKENHFIEYTSARVNNASKLMYDSFVEMKKFAESKNIHIVNASRGWKLDVFDKVVLEEYVSRGIQ